ncbi:LPXTG-motif cell wall anchor domain-containing protein [Evansella caseinilytica]|uniref:LPXTG-motif cell wall anchor domain-containing protein n=1 Tax=Evansella caseinilytica TaxID=1503961 RepID=A0A1H3Q553_9BACI|nr:SpaA isopeptide-forming pilin-related protein [Evansella caseinilytica]SDZ08507.1 LPXTG-motif cell wall anchor domain-containing protein [Evansella caseinilytica]
MSFFRKKVRIAALIVLLLTNTMMTSLGIPLQASATSQQGVSFQIALQDEAGNAIDAGQFPDHQVSVDSTVYLTIAWSIVNGESVAEGEPYVITIPAELAVKLQAGKLTTENKVEVGAYEITGNGDVSLLFTKTENGDISGNGMIEVEATVTASPADGENDLPLTFVVNGESRTITVPFYMEANEQVGEEEEADETADSTMPMPKTTAPETTEEDDQQETAAGDEATGQLVTMSGVEITENILTYVELRDEDGNTIHAETNPDIRPAVGSAAEIIYHWGLPNGHGYTAGSTFTFQLPDVFQLYNDIENEPLIISGIEVGTFTVTMDGTVTMTFNERIEQMSNISGMMNLWTVFREDLQGSVNRIIDFEAKDEVVTTIPVQFEAPEGSPIDKRGMANKGYNATEITWTVDFNKTLNSMENAVLKDPLQEGQTLQAGSIKVYKLDVQLDGSVVQGEELDPDSYVIEQVDGNDFQIVFGSIDSAYRVEFVADITDEDATTFTNQAILTGDNTDDLTAQATVSTRRGNPLAKSSTDYDPVTQTITWEMRYNYNEKSIAQALAVLTDLFPDSQELLADSFEVYRVTIDDNGNEAAAEEYSNFTVSETTEDGQNGFVFQFNEDIDAAYKIIYKTTATERVFSDETIVNRVTSGENSAEGTRNIYQQIFHKRHGQVNYAEKTVAWELVFNEDEYEMTNVTVADVFANGGLTLIEETFTITRAGETLVRDEDFTLVITADGFTVEFFDTITEPYRINYVTTFDYDARDDLSEDYLENQATLEWQPEDGSDVFRKDARAVFRPDNFTHNNGFKNGAYNAVTKEITWDIGINYNLQTLENVVVEDFIQDGQLLLADSIEVYEMVLDGSANGAAKGELLTEGGDYILELIEDGEGKPGFRVVFPGTIDTAYWITLKTSLNNQLIKASYDNQAMLFSDNKEAIPLDASVSVRHGGEYTNKSGGQNGRVIDWRININFGQSYVSDAVVTDTPSNNQILLEDTFRLYATEVATNGTMTKGAELERGQDYILEITTEDSGEQSFQLFFTDDIDSGYILEYQSYINARNGDTVENIVKFEGNQITTEPTESSEAITVRLSGGSGTGSGETGSLEVTKVDAATGEVLQGATFTLYDSEGQIAIRTLVTGEDGKVTFVNLLYDDYLLKEDNAPEGYLVGINDTQQVTVDSETNTVAVENAKIVRDVQLQKVDSETGAALQGAVFALQQKVEEDYITIAEVETDEDGFVFVEDLEPGEYQFVELNAPFGYELAAEPVPFTIGEEQTEVIELRKENHIILGAVQLLKADAADASIVLEGAEFSLVDEAGNVLREGLTTDENGQLTVTDLRPGVYQFVETAAPEHYLLDDTPYQFTIALGQEETLTVTATNDLIPGSVRLRKVDEENQAVVLEGAVFSLLDEAGNVVYEGLTTDETGEIIVADLRPGEYRFVETRAPEDYILDDEPHVVTIERSQEEQAAVTVTNRLAPGSVRLVKVDADEQTIVLEGAEFSLLDGEGNELLTGLKTDENGELLVSDLQPGDYQLVETLAPENYLLDGAPYRFTIERGQVEPITVTATNRLIPGSVRLVKVDADDQDIVLAGAEFSLLDEAGNVVYEGLTTDETGEIIVTDLRPGVYQFVETASPEHYTLDDTPYSFTIERNQETPITVTVTNQLTPGSVELVKVDADDLSIVLEGAAFSLLDEAGNVLLEELTTNASGKLTVDGLKPGNYQFVETKAPSGYKLDSTPIPFTIEQSQQETLSLVAVNEAVPQPEPKDPDQDKTVGSGETDQPKDSGQGVDKLPQTGEEWLLYFTLLGLLFLTAGGALLFLRKRNIH